MLRVTSSLFSLLQLNFITVIAQEHFPVLLFSKNSVFQFTIGVSVPLLATNKKGNVVFSAGFQFNYALPWNLTQLQSPSIIPSRHTDDFNLNNIYLSIENLFDRYNWSDGRQCLLRSICELAETPLNRVNTDVLVDVVHLLLTPSEDLPETVNSSRRYIDKLYHRAELLGRSGGDCASSYPGCAESPLNTIKSYCTASETNLKQIYPALPIVYPYGGAYKFILGISVPILTGKRILSYSQNFQFQYPLPQNSTHYFSTLKRRRRSISGNDERRIFYQLVEQELQRWSGNGKACMLKSICEASSVPLNRETLVENLLHVVLTPDYGNNSTFADKDYTEAALVGRRRDNCALIYSHCPEGYGLLDSISRIHSYYF